MTNRVWDVFVSYKSGADQGTAFELVAALEDRGVKCWIAPRDVPATAQMIVSQGLLRRAGYDDAIPFAIERSGIMAVVVSHEAMMSDHIKDEINLGKSAGVPFFPVRVADVPLVLSFKYHLGREQWFDCFEGTGPGRFQAVVSAVAHFLGIPEGRGEVPPPEPPQPGVAAPVPGAAPAPTPEPAAEPAPRQADEPTPPTITTGTPGRLDPRIEQELRSQRLQFAGMLLGHDELARCYARFAERFGPGVLANLHGEPLLRTMYDGSSRDSLAYWLERGDREHPAGTFGLISGGPPLTLFGLYRRSGVDVWVAGRHHADSREVTLAEAIDVASRFRVQLLAAWAVLQRFPASTDDGPYAALQAELDQVAPDLSNRAWVHKYFHMVRPDALDDFHNEELQEAHLISLLELPPPGRGRYLRAGRYVRIAGELGWPINHLATVLNHRPSKPRHGPWMAPATSVSHREGEVCLARSLPAGTVFVTCDGQDVTAIGHLRADHAGAAAWTPVEWLDQARWRLPEAERGGEAIKRLTSLVNRVAIERRIRDVAQPSRTSTPMTDGGGVTPAA